MQFITLLFTLDIMLISFIILDGNFAKWLKENRLCQKEVIKIKTNYESNENLSMVINKTKSKKTY